MLSESIKLVHYILRGDENDSDWNLIGWCSSETSVTFLVVYVFYRGTGVCEKWWIYDLMWNNNRLVSVMDEEIISYDLCQTI